MCKKYNVLDARKRVFFIVMELLEKAGRKAPCRSRTVRKESREESRYEKPFCTYAVRARTGRAGRSGRRVRIPRHTVRHGRALGISPAGDALGRRV